MLKILQTVGVRIYDSGCKARTMVLAECLSCGETSIMLQQNVSKHNREGRQHCQHCIKTTYHNMTNTRIWRIWQGMVWRSKNPLDKNYGGRGITICPDWENFSTFYTDMSPTYSDSLTIERVDVNQPYSKANCVWATNMVQQANKRTNRTVAYQGETIHLAELVRRSGISKIMLSARLNRGMTADQAVEDAKNSPYGKSQRPVDIRRREKRMSTTS